MAAARARAQSFRRARKEVAVAVAVSARCGDGGAAAVRARVRGCARRVQRAMVGAQCARQSLQTCFVFSWLSGFMTTASE